MGLVWLSLSRMDRKQIQISVKHLGCNKPSDYQTSVNNLRVVGNLWPISKRKKEKLEFSVSKSTFNFGLKELHLQFLLGSLCVIFCNCIIILLLRDNA